MLAGQLTTALYMQGFPIVVNSSLGSASVVTLTTVRTVCRLGLMPVQNVAYATSPQLSRSYGAMDMPLFHRMIKIMAMAAFWSGIGVVLALTTVGPWLLSKWTGGKISISHLTFGLFALSIAFQGLWVCFQLVLGCCNKHHFFNYFYCGSVALSLGVTLLLARPFGFNVVPVIMLVSDIMVAGMGYFLCTKKLDGFNPSVLQCVFQADFYRSLIAKTLSHRRPVNTQ
jgi:O-antigen/teichoic acid export membrane protein